MIGEIVGNFRVIQRLGKGGMGEVWLGEHKDIRTKVAIKVLSTEISADKQHVQRFFNEAVAVSKIKHAGIVKIFDVGFHTSGAAYLIMELLEGESLSARIKRVGRLPLSQLADIGRQIANVLEATHAEHITHRDLKPDNVFLIKDAELASGERVKVLDFGIAKLGHAPGMTGTGSMGTPSYMSPEQWTASGKVDQRADAYSLGCLVFELACGRPPFVASSIGEACNLHLHVAPPAARSVAPSLPESIDTLLACLLAKEPERRPTMAEVKAVFTALGEAQTGALEATMAGASARLPAALEVTQAPVAAPTSAAALRALAAASARPEPATGGVDTTLGASAAVIATGPAPKRVAPKLPWLVAGGGVAIAGVLAGYLATRGAGASEPAEPGAANPFVRIEPPAARVVLGVAADAPEWTRGFRPSRDIAAPTTAYAIQAHEVTWSELDPWLAQHAEHAAERPAWASDAATRARLPATNVSWAAARAYCMSLDGTLPTEEQWEYAARGVERRANPWGETRLDVLRTRVFGGDAAVPTAVATSDQDVTATGIHDLAGNVQEWTLDTWRADLPGQNEDWVQDAATQTVWKAIRGLPLVGSPPPRPPNTPPANASAAYREPLCASGACDAKAKLRLAHVGFRCVRTEP